MDNVITLFERQSIPYPTLGLAANDLLLETLDRLNQNAGKELIRLERKGLCTTQYVGVIQAGGRTIQILPKINCDPEAEYRKDNGFERIRGWRTMGENIWIVGRKVTI